MLTSSGHNARMRTRRTGLWVAVALLAGWLCDVGGTELSFAVAGATGLVMTAYTFRTRFYTRLTLAS